MTTILSAAKKIDPDIAEVIAQAPRPEDYPQAGAIILFDQLTVEVNQNGQITKSRHLLIKILQERGKDEYGDQTIRYDKDEQQVDILIARTHTPAGHIIEPEKDGITETSSEEVQYASAYSNAVQKGVHFPALEVGAVIELKYRLSTIPREEQKETYFGGTIAFGSTDPILQKRFSLTVPGYMPANSVVINGNIPATTEQLDNKRQLTWEMTNIPQVIREPSMVSTYNVVPHLVYSSMENWQDLAIWFGQTYFSHLTEDESIKAFVRDQGWRDLPPQEALKQAILYLTTSIRSVKLSLGLAGYEPLDEQVILEHKYGDCRDKTLLAIAILRELDINAYPFLVNNSEEDVADLPAIEQFNHILLSIDAGENGYLWFDLHDDNAAYGYLPNYLAGRWGLLVTPDGGFYDRTPGILLDENRAENVFRMTMDKNGDLSGTFVTECQGVFDRVVRKYLKDMKKREFNMHFQQAVSSICEGAVIEEYKVSDLKQLDVPARIELSITAQDYGVIRGEVALFYLPQIPLKATGFQNYTQLPVVNYPVNINHEGTVSYRLELNFPSNLKVGYFPPDDAAENEWASTRRTTTINNDHLTIDTEFTYKTPVIPSEHYSQAKDLYTRMSQPQNWMVIFER